MWTRSSKIVYHQETRSTAPQTVPTYSQRCPETQGLLPSAAPLRGRNRGDPGKQPHGPWGPSQPKPPSW